MAYCCAMAQDVNDSTHTVHSEGVRVITDTIRANELLNTSQVDEVLEDYLWQQLEAQSQRLHADSSYMQLAKQSTDSANIRKKLLLSEQYHPLCIELIFKPLYLSIDKPTPYSIYSNTHTSTALSKLPPIILFSDEIQLCELRNKARSYITGHAADIYTGTFMDLPQLDALHKRGLLHNNAKRLRLGKTDKPQIAAMEVERIKRAKWFYKGSALLQFSQNYVSKNWYNGGNSNVAILGIAEGSIKYDNHNNIVWENTGEWRAGFNSVSGDTLRSISTSDDLLRLQSKLGFKAFNKFYYTGAIEFQTQFFHSYEGINSPVLKSSTFSPIRFNISFGLDYKPHKGVSIMLAPVSYKYIYVMDTTRVDQTKFGVKPEKKSLNEVGSSIKVTYSYQPLDGLQLDSRFYFYTNYHKVEVELEVTANFVINRYFSARLSLHPRYDNTIILPNHEKARLQFKEFLSVGFSHKFKQAGTKKHTSHVLQKITSFKKKDK